MRCLLVADAFEVGLETDCEMPGWDWHAVRAVLQLAWIGFEHIVYACHGVREVLKGWLVVCNRYLPGTEYGHDIMQLVVGKPRRKLLVGRLLEARLPMANCNNCCFEQESHSTAVVGLQWQQSVLECSAQLTVAGVQDSNQSACAFEQP